jgi:hypothetical protein
MMEAVSTSEMSVYFYKGSWHNIPEACYLLTHYHENLNSRSHIWAAKCHIPQKMYKKYHAQVSEKQSFSSVKKGMKGSCKYIT